MAFSVSNSNSAAGVSGAGAISARNGATQRIVVQTTTLDKRAIVAKAKKLDIPISELMRRGAFAYQSDESDDALNALANAAKGAADRCAAAIDDALDFIASSNQRIASMEAGSRKSTPQSGRKTVAKAPKHVSGVASRSAHRKAA